MEIEEALAKISELEKANSEYKWQLEKVTADRDDYAKNFDAYRKGHTVKDDDYQLTATERDTLKKEHDELKTTVEKRETERKEKFIEKTINEMTKGDARLAEKLKAEYSILNLPDGNEDEIAARFQKANAFVQASSGGTPSPMDAAGGGTPGSGDGGQSEEKMSPAAQGFFNQLMTKTGGTPIPTSNS